MVQAIQVFDYIEDLQQKKMLIQKITYPMVYTNTSFFFKFFLRHLAENLLQNSNFQTHHKLCIIWNLEKSVTSFKHNKVRNFIQN